VVKNTVQRIKMQFTYLMESHLQTYFQQRAQRRKLLTPRTLCVWIADV